MNLLLIFLALIAIIAIVLMIVYLLQEKFIFLKGEKIDREHQFTFSNKFEEIFIKTDGNNVVNALHFKLDKPKGIILYCHGNNGNLEKWGSRVSYFLNYNYDVLVFDYRNYGKSTGAFIEDKMYNDALLVYKHIKASFKEEEIVVYGFSLGSTFATKIASINKPKELILEAPFFNFNKAVKFYSKLAPTFLLKYKFRSDLDIVNVLAPITIFHGNKDQITSFKEAKLLLEQNSCRDNYFVKIEGGTHHNIRDSKLYKLKLQEILNR